MCVGVGGAGMCIVALSQNLPFAATNNIISVSAYTRAFLWQGMLLFFNAYSWICNDKNIDFLSLYKLNLI